MANSNASIFSFQRIIIGLSAFLIMVTVLSLTIGRDLYLGMEPNMTSFSITHFAGYLFFLVMPVEGLFIYYLTEHLDPVLLTILAVATALLALVIDYLCGYLVSKQFIQYFIRRDRYEKAQSFIKKYGKKIGLDNIPV